MYELTIQYLQTDKAFRSEQSLQYHLGLAHLDPDGSMVSEDLPEPWHESSDEQMEEESNPIQKVGDKFVCTQCPDRPEFNQRGHLWKHIYRRHQTEKRIKCEVCGKGLLDKHSYTEHMRRHLGDKPFQCTLCKAGFVARYILQAHMVTHNNRGELVYRTKFACKWCHMSFNARLPLNNHILAKHLAECVLNPSDPENPFSCVICDGFAGENANDLTTHLTEHVQAQSGNSVTVAIHTCDVCGRTYKHKRHLNRHAKSHMGIKPFECDICGKRFTEAFDLGEHRRIHDAIKTVPCPYCDKCFPSNIRRNEHVRKKHSEEKPYHCPRCPEKFSDFRSEANHRMDVHGEKNLIHECWKCGKTYVNADRHRKHESICVGGEKASKKERKANGEMATSLYSESYDCGVCGRSYTQRKHLNRHTKSHKSGRSHSCEICGTSFYEAHRLQEHKRIHDKKRRFDCTYCEKNFSSSWRRNEHERKAHHEEKTFKCPSCPERFSDIRSKALHRMEVHEEQNLIHECSKCSRVYTKADRLKKHEACPDRPEFDLRNHLWKHIYRRHQPEKRIKCDVCGKGFLDKYSFTEHMRRHLGDKPFQCHLCKSSFVARYILETHMVTHNNRGEIVYKTKYSCSWCHMCFPSRQPLNNHILSKHLTECVQNPSDPENPFRCVICDAFTGETANDLTTHLTEHVLAQNEAVMANAGHTCNVCGRKYKHKRHLNRHAKTHLGIKPFECDVCGKRFTEASDFGEHKLIHDPIKTVGCPYCDKFFQSNIRRNEHIRKKHSEVKPYHCPRCPEKFSDLRSEANHRMDVHGEKNLIHECWKCGKTYAFLRQDSLKRHEMRVHSEDVLKDAPAVLKCPHCPKAFVKQSSLKRHDSKTHNKGRVPTCHLCEKTFRKTSHLVRHIKSHTREKPYVCRFCGKAFFENWQLTKHEPTHDPNYEPPPTNSHEPILCNICSNYFANPQSFKRHQANVHGLGSRTGRTAKEERAFLCCICSKGFTTQGLKAHMITHSDVRPFQCQLCSATFRRNGELKVHMLCIHAGEDGRQFVCALCSKRFVFQYLLNNHMKTHDAVKRKEFSCHLCQKEFRHACSLSKHLKKHDQSKDVTCDACQLSFFDGMAFRRHVREVHDGEGKTTISQSTRSKRSAVKAVVVDGLGVGTVDEDAEDEEDVHIPDEREPDVDKPVEEQKYLCATCSRGFPTECQLRIHEKYHSDERQFLCSQCSKKFKTTSALKIHERFQHTESRPMPHGCHLCPRRFCLKYQLYEHHNRHCAEPLFSCDLCKKSYAQRGSLRKHLKAWHGLTEREANVNKVQCRYCGAYFGKRKQLKKHALIHKREVRAEKCTRCHHQLVRREEEVFACSFCGETHISERALKVHENKHRISKGNTCSVCNKSFQFASLLILHQKFHTGERPFKCDQCDKRYFHNRILRRHKFYYHSNAVGVLCLQCKMRFLDSGDLKKHNRETHAGHLQCDRCPLSFSVPKRFAKHQMAHKRWQFFCRFCNRPFMNEMTRPAHEAYHVNAQSAHIVSHMRSHTDERPFVCPTCGKAFRNAHGLKIHEMIHQGKKRHQCTVCGEEFWGYPTYKRHLDSHKTGGEGVSYYSQNQLVCPVCGKIVKNTKSAIDKHMRGHTGDKPFACPVPDCLKSFVERKCLENHMRKHTGERPYACETCGNTYPRPDTLAAHVKTVHALGAIYACDRCDKHFTRKYYMEKHRQKCLKEKEGKDVFLSESIGA
ncbi:unnamed protein product [Cyprideis torosa]|uniref:Uncharacterized protein n=1 Tax=Cyprideis torosa TaxID=163714 RepID=A0A7R8ZK13_9CRUS|nr:unnamed protein product [Cyprideis torosa]CAG0883486.1 unnamed protein product [Cyprideis torosa]